MNEMQVFNNEEFGEIRMIEKQGKPYFNGKDVATALGYRDSVNAIKLHCRKDGVVKHHLIDKLGRKQTAAFIDEGNLYRLITHSKLPEAEKFENWVFDEVLPTIRKTGEYKVKDKPLTSYQRERENRLKAELLYKVSQDIAIPEYKQVLQSGITQLILGYAAIPLPAVDKLTYSAGEAGMQLGMTGNMFGRLTKKHGLRTEEYGKLFYDKSPYSAKEVETFRYYDTAIEAIRKIIEAEVA